MSPLPSKTCKDCGQSKPLDEFWRNAQSRDGRYLYCKPCGKARHAGYRSKNPQWRRSRTSNILKSRYNITIEQYEEMLDRQGGVCAACGETCKTGQSLAVDHDHGCCPGDRRSCGGCVRGLLCRSCNQALGFIERDNSHLFAYLDRAGSLALDKRPHGAALD